mmetsp:Transcript_8739/g.21764  ORF Transcript_8739/g.21764 Transcript_8739/m.21764 type:complete len:270 (+) Transcript_8739:420-1229(+)
MSHHFVMHLIDRPLISTRRPISGFCRRRRLRESLRPLQRHLGVLHEIFQHLCLEHLRADSLPGHILVESRRQVARVLPPEIVPRDRELVFHLLFCGLQPLTEGDLHDSKRDLELARRRLHVLHLEHFEALRRNQWLDLLLVEAAVLELRDDVRKLHLHLLLQQRLGEVDRDELRNLRLDGARDIPRGDIARLRGELLPDIRDELVDGVKRAHRGHKLIIQRRHDSLLHLLQLDLEHRLHAPQLHSRGIIRKSHFHLPKLSHAHPLDALH